jgi:hypothetical protein
VAEASDETARILKQQAIEHICAHILKQQQFEHLSPWSHHSSSHSLADGSRGGGRWPEIGLQGAAVGGATSHLR